LLRCSCISGEKRMMKSGEGGEERGGEDIWGMGMLLRRMGMGMGMGMDRVKEA
jgi:hypothetical protein